MKKAIPILYAHYGRYIDEFRAMPGIDDCLKPVERRTLYALHEIAPTKFVKSARVVGETIAKYHAHGDQSCYETLVNLVNRGFGIGQGNFGHEAVKPVPAAAYRYCVTGDTLIPTEYGIYPISQLKTLNNQNSNVISFDNSWNIPQTLSPAKFVPSGKDDIFQLTTVHGYELKGNPHHPIITINYDDLELSWKELKDIKKDDIVILSSISSNIQESISDDNDKFTLLGALYGQPNGLNLIQKNDISFKTTDKVYFEKILKIINKIHFESNVIIQNNGKHTTYKIDLNSDFWHLFILPYQLSTSDSLGLPSLIWNGSKSDHKCFLQTLFEGSSYVNTEYIYFNKSSYQFTKDIQLLLLLRFNLLTTRLIGKQQSNKSTSWRLQIVGEKNIIKFIQEIGFFASKQSIIPFDTSKIIVDRPDFYKVVNEAKINSKKPNINKIFNLSRIIYSTNLKFERVQDCHKLEKQEEVYTLSVDNPSHSYISNGFISHNTECKINPKINKFAFELIKYTPYHDPEELEELQPDYIPCPIPIGLIGTGLISGISFNSTKIPRYKPKDLFNRLTNIFYRQIDPNLQPHTIIPCFPNFDIYENTPGECERILSTGQGILILRPKYTVDGYGVHVFGRPPMGCSSWLKEDTDVKKIKYACDDLSGKQGFEALFTPKNGARLDQDFINMILNLITIKIHFYCNIWDGTKVRLVSIDELLLRSYDNWSNCLNLKMVETQKNISNKLREMQVIEVIRYFLDNSLNIIKKIEDLCNLYESFMNDPNKQLPSQYVQDVTIDEIKTVCKKHTIQKLFEYHIDKSAAEKEMQDINHILNNFSEYAYDVAKSYFV